MWPRDIDQNVLLVPDLASYDVTDPAKLPGVEQHDFVLEGWDLSESFFSYRENKYTTNFGIQNFVGKQDLPELYFNLGLKRNFLNGFISNMIPIIVVALLLFAVLLTITSREEDTRLFGFSTSGVLSFCGALFFVIIVSHIGLRNSLATQGLVYLENFYFVMYGAILLVGINSILVALPEHAKFTSYRDNLIFRLLYWPAILGTMLAITIVAFY